MPLIKSGFRGSAMTEVVVMLPIYCFMLIATVYFGNLALIEQQADQAAGFSAQTPEVEGPGDVADFFKGILAEAGEEGTSSVADDPDYQDNDNPPTFPYDAKEVRDLIVEVEYNPVGTYTYVGGQLVYDVKVRKTHWAGAIDKYDMKASSQDVAGTLNEYARYGRCEIGYTYELARNIPDFGGGYLNLQKATVRGEPSIVEYAAGVKDVPVSSQSIIRGNLQRGQYVPGTEPGFVKDVMARYGMDYQSLPAFANTEALWAKN